MQFWCKMKFYKNRTNFEQNDIFVKSPDILKKTCESFTGKEKLLKNGPSFGQKNWPEMVRICNQVFLREGF